MYYILDEANQVVPTDDVLIFGESLKRTKCILNNWVTRKPLGKANSKMGRKINRLRAKQKRVWVSTVFLGIDHSFFGGRPIVFETMGFNNRDYGDEVLQYRYTTYDKAVKGHAEAIQEIKFRTILGY